MGRFHVADVLTLKERIITMFSDDWFLLTAGSADNFNMMTCAWGAFGYLWNKPVSFVFVRPQRYTYEFMESSDRYTISFFDENHRDKLAFCGSKSGRDVDKVRESGLTPVTTQTNTVYFDEAKMVFICRKLYFQDILRQGFVDKKLAESVYPEHDYHRMYVGHIEKLLVTGT
jgi:flavin reductase (DIM6/NTAB) family NADH-FMN oxidoreductase RutF